MLPVLIHIGFLKIYSFGVFVVLALLWGMFFVWKYVKLTALKEEEVFDMVFVGILSGAIISRLLYVLLHWSQFGLDISRIILINGYPGLSLYGFLFGFLGSLYLLMERKKIRFIETIDYVIPGLFLALSIGKLGSFIGGIDVGSQTTFFLSVLYPGYEGLRHITAVYEALLYLIFFIISQQILFSIRRERFHDGFLIVFFTWSVSLITLSLDTLKDNQVYWGSFSSNGLISIVLLVVTTIYGVYYWRKQLVQIVTSISRKLKKA
ncbi:MAG: Prolipoprotein diacylglyceryl transferase [Microgenomates bacterium OLB22]|nr:MAG: Prolipoprotein diacylglyceryl transferase [Microgenomates bacterium OLB22]